MVNAFLIVYGYKYDYKKQKMDQVIEGCGRRYVNLCFSSFFYIIIKVIYLEI